MWNTYRRKIFTVPLVSDRIVLPNRIYVFQRRIEEVRRAGKKRRHNKEACMMCVYACVHKQYVKTMCEAVHESRIVS